MFKFVSVYLGAFPVQNVSIYANNYTADVS